MGKLLALLGIFSMVTVPIFGFEKLDSTYQITYGSAEAPLKLVEYFSFSCPKCLQFLQKDFPKIKQKYINSGKVNWTFHPDPADLVTFQAMVCLEKLDDEQKRLLLDVVAKNLEEFQSHGLLTLQAIMELMEKPVPQLSEFKFLETTTAFQKAFGYLKQKDVVTALPTVEINGNILKEFPTFKFLDLKLSTLLQPHE